MITVTVTGLEQARATLQQLAGRSLANATSTALTRAAWRVQETLVQEMTRVFDRPTPATLKSILVKPSIAETLRARVWVRDDLSGAAVPPSRWLRAEVDGEQRRPKRIEVALRAAGHLPPGWFVVPGRDVRLDAYGNMTRGQVIQILSQLRIQLVAGSRRNMAFDARKQINAQKRAGGRYFVIPPGGRMPPGVYQREWFVREASLVLLFVKGVRYRPRLDFFGLARKTVDKVLPQEAERAVRESLQRAAARAAAGRGAR